MGMFQHKLVVRFAALAALSLTLVIVLREDNQGGLSKAQAPQQFQVQTPVIRADIQPDSPLAISAERQLDKTEQAPEVAYNVTNVTNKTITAFAVKLEVSADSKSVATVSLNNLEVVASNLPPNQSLNQFTTYDNFANAQHRVTLSVDFVQFSDGTTWGRDSAKSAERVAGQRAGIDAVTSRVSNVVRGGKPNELAGVLDSILTTEPATSGHSEAWNEGFRSARLSVANRFKRANSAGGLNKVNSELSRFATKQ